MGRLSGTKNPQPVTVPHYCGGVGHMNSLLCLTFPYPGPSAAARLLRLVVLGLREAGVGVRILASAYENAGLSPWRPDADGIPFRSRGWPSRSRMARGWRFLRMPREMARLAAEEMRLNKPDVLLLYGHSHHALKPLVAAAAQAGVRAVTFATEQWPLDRQIPFTSLDNWRYRKILQPKLNGVLAISQWLAEDAHRSGVPVLRIPALGEITAPAPQKTIGKCGFNLTYVGTLFKRDLPCALLDGFNRALEKNNNHTLTVIGHTNSTADGRRFQNKVRQSLCLRERVRVTGWVSEEELRRLMNEADAFVILRDDDIPSRACFPSRLPGFLLTARPVILSAVGEVKHYFRHNENAWMLPPGNAVAELARAIEELAAAPAQAAKIGATGRQTALDEFRYDLHGARVAAFLRTLP